MTSQQALSWTDCYSQLRHKVSLWTKPSGQWRTKPALSSFIPPLHKLLQNWNVFFLPQQAKTHQVTWYHHLRENSRSSVLVQNPVLCRIRSANSCDGYLFLPSWEELVWTAACSLDQSAEPEAAARSETLMPSTPKPSQYSAAACERRETSVLCYTKTLNDYRTVSVMHLDFFNVFCNRCEPGSWSRVVRSQIKHHRNA